MPIQLIGVPVLPPYWSLGYQISHEKLENLDRMKTFVQSTIDARIPLVNMIITCFSNSS